MGNLPQLDPKAMKIQKAATIIGTGVVGAATFSAIVIFGISGAILTIAGIAGIAGLIMVNFVIPLAAEGIGIARQKALTALAENFSEETLRKNEQDEIQRVQDQGNAYVVLEGEYETAIAGLEKQLKNVTSDEEKKMLEDEIAFFKEDLAFEWEDLQQKKKDLTELSRKTEIWIAMDRAARTKSKIRRSQADAQQIQAVQTSITAIQKRLRTERAGSRLRQINSTLEKKEGNNFNFLIGRENGK